MEGKSKLLIYIFLLMFLLSGCTKSEYEFQKEVEAVVTDKEYKEPYTRLDLDVPIACSEKYYVKFKYKQLTNFTDDKELYNDINIGDKVKVNLYKKKDKEIITYEKIKK